ncbi:hypothetical protein FRB93_002129 [Tulasnella sp. JGI-2019a]|nr:hypothetical protein FRB93_002129 [Tulasnella sp. JGI-2019a]
MKSITWKSSLVATCFIFPTFSLSLHGRADPLGLISERGVTVNDPLVRSNSDGSDSGAPTEAGGSSKYVFAHFIVGNTYPYGVGDWIMDMQLARKAGIDGFALNVGADYWQASKIADAFNASLSIAPIFKLFFSFDMTSLPCSGSGDADALHSYISEYHNHPAQLVDDSNRMVISTFGGEYCTFGQGSLNAGWEYAVKQGMPSTAFIPAFFGSPDNFQNYPVMDGDFYWDGGWPLDDSSISFNRDQAQINGVGKLGPGKVYMAPVSPWFFTHYGPDSYNKNFIYKSDNHLYASRWEILVQQRDKIAIAQIITWNDYGESHYIGRIAGAQPDSQAWTDGFDHTGWLEATRYYIEAFKTGVYPVIREDRVILSARPHARDADANDHVERPTNWQWTDDYLWALVFATAPGVITLSSGSNSQSYNVVGGVSKLQLAQGEGGVGAAMSRNGENVYSFSPTGFSFTLHPSSYNFNAYVAAGP